MIKHHTASQNPQSGKEVAKQGSRYSASYWLGRVIRPTYLRDGERFEVPQWHARIQHAGRRQTVGLGTNNQEEAARQAAKLFKTIQTKGWQAALFELDPESSTPRNMETVGGYLSTCEPLFDGRKITWIGYAYALRKIAREISEGQEKSADKYDPFHKTWQTGADKIKLAVLDPLSIQKWKRGCVAAAGSNAVAQLRARRNVNSFLLNARTLFGKKMAKRRAAAKLPVVPNPFDGVDLEPSGDVRYVSTIQAKDLLSAAKAELEQKDPDAYLVILLALGAGLRRGEIDSLCTTHLDFEQSQIRVMISETFQTKTDGSEGVVFVDPGLLAEIKRHLNNDGLFVVAPTTAAALNRAPGYCRCEEAFSKVTAWLRAHGVNSKKPLHTLRKEFGSLVNQATDIHTASRQLRHATIKMTAAVYTDHRRRPGSAVPIGAMLNTPAKTDGKEAAQ